jgi:hypothetical protein
VDKWEVWKEEEFAKVYAAVDGHKGSLRRVFDKNKLYSVRLDEAVRQVDDEADRQLKSALEASKSLTETEKWLKDFKGAGFLLHVVVTSAHLHTLLSNNILFQKGFDVYPQRRVLRDAIDRYVSDFVDQASFQGVQISKVS